MRRGKKIIAGAAGLVILLPLLALAGVIVAANTAPGRQLVEELATEFSDGTVTLQGLSGRFPDALQVSHAELRDPTGPWMTIDDLTLDWSPLALLRGEVRIDRLTAMHIVLLRRPATTAQDSSPAAGPALPLRVVVTSLAVDRLDLATAVAGVPATLRLTGQLAFTAPSQGSATLAAERLDAPGSYRFTGSIGGDTLAAHVSVMEPGHGLVAGIADLPDLGPLSIAADLDGPRAAEHARLDLVAGPLRAAGEGTIDLTRQTIDVDLSMTAPAMTPRPDLHWQGARLTAHLHGSFTRPDATGKLELDGLTAAGGTIDRLSADLTGSGGKIALAATLAGLRLPGPEPDLFGTTPITVRADATLDAPTRPVSFSLSDPLITVTGQATTAGEISASLSAILPRLAPFAGLAALDLDGRGMLTATLTQHGETMRIAVDGSADATSGSPLVSGLLGNHATFALAGALHGDDVTIDHATLDGTALHVAASGSRTNSVFDGVWTATVADISVVAPTLSGRVDARGRLHGTLPNLAVDAQATGDLAVAGLPKAPLTISLHAEGLPAAPTGRIDVGGRLAGAPVEIAAMAQRDDDGTVRISIERARWKSLDARGALTLPRDTLVPVGQLRLRIARLGDFDPLIGDTLTGSVDAALDTVAIRGKTQLRAHIDVQHLAAQGSAIAHAIVDATVDEPATHPSLKLELTATGIDAAGVTGSAKLSASGTPAALALHLSSDLQAPHGAAQLSATATARPLRRELRLTTLQAEYSGETARLLAPVAVGFASGLAIDRLRLGVGAAVLTASGRLTPTLALTVSVRDLDAGLAKPFIEGLPAAGTIALDANLTGTLTAPNGTVHVTGHGLRLLNDAGRAIPAVEVEASATLRGGSSQIDARLSAGSSAQMQVIGTAPLQATAALDLKATGSLDLAMLDPLTAAEGRIVRGRTTFDLAINGSIDAPHVDGTVSLANGAVRDFVQGVSITAIDGFVSANGDTLRLTRLTGHAGPGTLSATGTVALTAGVPVDLVITAKNARPLVSDLLTATMDGSVTLRGKASGELSLAGQIAVSRADINIPESFPQSVAVIEVRRPGQAPPPAGPVTAVALALQIDAPQQVFVRGHGLDTEMGGSLHIAGTTLAPQINGGFDLRRGTFSLAGQTLAFTSGRVAFDGTSLVGKLDPTLNFVAQRSSGSGVTATLTITGYADSPKIQLSSTPALPQDEILAQLLFGQSVKQLSPFQLAGIAQALASLGGVGGGIDPLGAVRRSLGLDRLSVSGASGRGFGATVEAGKYLANGVYVGTRQGTSGGTQAQVQIDLTKHLKLETTIGTGSGAPATGVTPDNDPGSSVGLTYQFEY